MLIAANSPDLVEWGQPVNWSHPLNLGLVNWYMAVPNRMGWGSTKWRDMCSQRRHLALTNMDSVTDWIGSRDTKGFGSLDFDGSNDHCEVTEGTFSRTTFSIVISYYNLSIPGSSHIFCSTRASGNTGWAFNSDTFNNTGQIGLTTFGVADTTSGISAPSDAMAACSFVSGTSMSFWVNGTTATPAASTLSAATLDGFVCGAGHRNGAALSHTGCRIRWIRFYNRALPLREYDVLYRESQRGFPETLNRYRLPMLSPQEAAAGLSIPIAAYHYNHHLTSMA